MQKPFYGVRTSFSRLLLTWKPGTHPETATVDVECVEGRGDWQLPARNRREIACKTDLTANTVSRAWKTEKEKCLKMKILQEVGGSGSAELSSAGCVPASDGTWLV